MTEKFIPAPGDNVWVKLKDRRVSLWWPGKVINPHMSPLHYNGKKKLVATVMFPSDETITFVTDENSIHPFNCAEKESFLDRGRELQHRNRKLRLAFDFDVCHITKKEECLASHEAISVDTTPAPHSMQQQNTRCRSELQPVGKMSGCGSPYFFSTPLMYQRRKRTQAYLLTDVTPSRVPIHGKSLIAEESSPKHYATPEIEPAKNTLENGTDGISAFPETSGKPKMGDTFSGDVNRSISRVTSPPVCILFPQASREGNMDISPTDTLSVSLVNQLRGAHTTLGANPLAGTLVSQHLHQIGAAPKFGAMPQTYSASVRLQSLSPTVDDLCWPKTKSPGVLWMPMTGDHTYTVERCATSRRETPDTSTEHCTCSATCEIPLARKRSFVRKHRLCVKKFASVSKRPPQHSPMRQADRFPKLGAHHSQKRHFPRKNWTSAKKWNKWAHAANRWKATKHILSASSRCAASTNSKLTSGPGCLNSDTSKKSSSKRTATITTKQPIRVAKQVCNVDPSVCVNTSFSSDQKTSATMRLSTSNLLSVAAIGRSSDQPSPVFSKESVGGLATVTEKNSTSSQFNVIANVSTNLVPVAATAQQSSSNQCHGAANGTDLLAAATEERSTTDHQTVVVNRGSPELLPASATVDGPSIAEKESWLSGWSSTVANGRSFSVLTSGVSVQPFSNMLALTTNAKSSTQPSATMTRNQSHLANKRSSNELVLASVNSTMITNNKKSMSLNCSDSDEDGDLPEMSLNSGMTGPISVGDLVWLKSRGFPFWPAIVKKVYKQKGRVRKITCCFIRENNEQLNRYGTYTALCHKKNVVPFSIDPLQHSRLKELGMQSEYVNEFSKAVKRAEDFICQWAVEKTVTSLEFFADDIGTTLMSGLNGDPTSCEEEDPMDAENPSTPSLSEDQQHGSNSINGTSKDSVMSDAQRKRIERRKEFGQKLIDVIKSNQTKQYLQKIWMGKAKCMRHSQFMQRATLSRQQKWELKMQGHGGPIGDDDQIDELVLTVADFYRSSNPDINMSYVIDVLVPEAVVYAIHKVRHVKKSEAEKIFQKGIRWTKEETAAMGRDLIRNADNIDPEDRIMYREKVDRLARRLSFAV